jgi:hypothetical protein
MVNVSGGVFMGVPVVLPGVVLVGAANGSGTVLAGGGLVGEVGVPLAGVPGAVDTWAIAAVELIISIDSNIVFMTFGIDGSKVRR